MISGKIAKNALVLFLATTGQKVVAFFAFMLVARIVGAEITGAYFYGVSVTSVFVILSDLGMTPVVIRAIASARKDAYRLLGAAVQMKLLLVPVAVVCSLGYGWLRGNDPVLMWTIAAASIAMAADAFHLVFYGALRGRQNLKPEAIGMFIGQVLVGVSAVSAALLGWGPIALAGSLAVGSIWNMSWALINLIRFNVSFRSFHQGDLKRLAVEALPFAIAGISVKIYSYVDSLMLEAFKGTKAVGFYAVAYKLTYAMQFIPLTFTAALYPALSASFAKKQRTELRDMFLGSMRLMAAVGFPISAGFSAQADRLIPVIYGDGFSGSIGAMAILPWVLLPIFIDFPIGALLNGTQRAHLKTMAMVGTMLMNVILNVLLVPIYGPVGAAWAGVFSFWFLLLLGILFSYQDAGGMKPIADILFRALFAGGLSWFVWKYIAVVMPLPIGFLFGACMAVLFAFAVRLVTYSDIAPAVLALRKRFGWGEQIHES